MTKGFAAMKPFQIVPTALMFALAVTQAAAEEIETVQRFEELVVGKKLVQDKAWVRILTDGKVEGKGPKVGDIHGSWEWKDGLYCRDIVIDGEPLPHDCQSVSIAGDTVTFSHNDGSGISVSWSIE